MAAEKLGVKETKEALHCLFLFVQAAIDAADDSKFGFDDVIRFLKVLPALPPAVSGASLLGAELADLDDAEKAELYEMLEKDLKIPNAMVDLFVKQGVKVLLALADFLPHAKKLS